MCIPEDQWFQRYLSPPTSALFRVYGCILQLLCVAPWKGNWTVMNTGRQNPAIRKRLELKKLCEEDEKTVEWQGVCRWVSELLGKSVQTPGPQRHRGSAPFGGSSPSCLLRLGGVFSPSPVSCLGGSGCGPVVPTAFPGKRIVPSHQTSSCMLLLEVCVVCLPLKWKLLTFWWKYLAYPC